MRVEGLEQQVDALDGDETYEQSDGSYSDPE